MRIGYIVLAYKDSEQLARLLGRIATERSSVVVHVDRSTEDHVYLEMRQRARQLSNVRFLERQRTYWGGFGLVEATVRGIEQLVENEIPFDYTILLTGQDYPLRSPSAIEQFLSDAGGRSFIHHSPIPYWGWGQRGGLNRLEKWHFIGRRRYHVRVPWKRTIPGGLQAFGGEAYWCLSRPVVEYVASFADTNAKFVRFFKHVLIPDEMFFHTVVMNSPFRQDVVNDTLHYIDWATDPGPAILTKDDFDRMVNSEKLFARKFDIRIDRDVLDMLDAHIEETAQDVLDGRPEGERQWQGSRL